MKENLLFLSSLEITCALEIEGRIPTCRWFQTVIKFLNLQTRHDPHLNQNPHESCHCTGMRYVQESASAVISSCKIFCIPFLRLPCLIHITDFPSYSCPDDRWMPLKRGNTSRHQGGTQKLQCQPRRDPATVRIGFGNLVVVLIISVDVLLRMCACVCVCVTIISSRFVAHYQYYSMCSDGSLLKMALEVGTRWSNIVSISSSFNPLLSNTPWSFPNIQPNAL